MPVNLGEINNTFQNHIERTCDVDLNTCMECGKCSGGCSNIRNMNYSPRKIIQLIKLGDETKLLNGEDMWLCVGCNLCVDRCPSGIDIPRIMDCLKETAAARGIKPAREHIALFHQLLLGSVFKRGRIAESTLMIRFNTQTGQYLKDAGLGLKLFLKGKLNPFSPMVKDIDSVRRFFKKDW